MSVACSSPPLLSSSSCSTATLDAQCSLSDLNHDHPRPVFPAGPQPRPSPPSVPCRTSTTTIHAQCSLPDLNREYPRQVFPAGPHVGRYGTKNVQKKVRKNVRQVCYILLANSRVCGRVTGAMPLLTLQQLAEFIKDKPRRSVLYQTAAEFRKAVGQVSASETRKHIEKAICSEPLSKEHGDASPAREEPVAGVETEAQFTADDNPRLVVPTGKAYAKMWEPGFWQEWNPMDWCYGDCVYGDERLNDKPYKRTSFQEIAKHWLLREELEYDLYEGENYVAEHGEPKLWEHQPDVELLLKQLEEAEQQRPRVSCSGRVVPFAVNRFCMHPVNIMVIATFWRMMSGFMAVNVGLRIPGIQTQLKSLAQLPDQLALLSSKEGEAESFRQKWCQQAVLKCHGGDHSKQSNCIVFCNVFCFYHTQGLRKGYARGYISNIWLCMVEYL